MLLSYVPHNGRYLGWGGGHIGSPDWNLTVASFGEILVLAVEVLESNEFLIHPMRRAKVGSSFDLGMANMFSSI